MAPETLHAISAWRACRFLAWFYRQIKFHEQAAKLLDIEGRDYYQSDYNRVEAAAYENARAAFVSIARNREKRP